MGRCAEAPDCEDQDCALEVHNRFAFGQLRIAIKLIQYGHQAKERAKVKEGRLSAACKGSSMMLLSHEFARQNHFCGSSESHFSKFINSGGSPERTLSPEVRVQT